MSLGSRTVLLILIALSIVVGVYEAALFGFGRAAGPSFQVVWSLIFLCLLIYWLELDAKERHISRPYEFGFLLLLFWLPYLPYYLVRTRRIRGIFWLLGFVLLFFLGYFLQWLVYVAR